MVSHGSAEFFLPFPCEFLFERIMAKKKYGVRGMLEYTAVLKAGNAKLHVHFTGGNLSGYGVIPAYFVTDNAVVQHIIEQSEEFKRGKISLLRTYADAPSSEEVATTGEDGKAEGASLEVVAMKSLADAKEYLVEQFGEKPSGLRSKDAVLAAGVRHGVQFEIG